MMRRIYLTLCALMYVVLCSSNSIAQAQTLNTSPRQNNLQSSVPRTNATAYAWSAWGSWSTCSRSCGGGVAVQERKCLPRQSDRTKRSRKRRKLLKNPEHSRSKRSLSTEPDCPGLGRRYHECNTAPCPGRYRDHRSEQCAVYDRRPFRGRFYTWVPYIDGKSPCTLNCRPRGQQFYASLALVEDGTPCTKPGFRAICIHGSCMVVGREGVLAAASSRELRCGRQLVAGLFRRPRLPLGYSYITTVPRGACRLNVTEIQSSENYIALKVTNGSYIMNGEFAVSAPGNYEAAGTRFVYTRVAGLDSIFAMGPIHHAIDIMVLYTQQNPNIKYEYLAPLDDIESNNIPSSNSISEHHKTQHHHRHHNSENSPYLNHNNNPEQVASRRLDTSSYERRSQLESNSIETRKFGWKILNFTPCSRSCGGGLQVGKFKCAELSSKRDREVSPAHCEGSPPPSKRRRCGGAPCPPRWRSAAWGPCPVCGPAHRTRIVGCVQDHARGITKISDQKCPLPMPPSSEPCDIPNCDGTVTTTLSPRLDARRQVRPKDRTDNFREGPIISLAYNSSDNEVTPTLSNSYSYSGAGGWLYTEWSDCVGWCNGVQSRGIRCNDPSGCSPLNLPPSSQSCPMQKNCDPIWFSTEWSACSAPCSGRQVRTVICMGPNWRRLKDTFCHLPKPETERACGGTCAPSWYLSDWGECKGPCEAGFQSRTVWCARGGIDGAAGPARDIECAGLRPVAKKTCVPARCTSRPVARPTVINPPASVSDAQQRVTRNQNHNTPSTRGRSLSDDPCVDKLSTCVLAVQARLCHYPYYEEYCCHSCHSR